jgi:phage protein U
MFATLGEIIFVVLTSFQSFRSTSGYRYAEHKVVEAPPRLQWIGDELEKVSIDLRFHAAFTNPAIQMQALQAAAEDHQARALVFGNGVFRGYFVIESLEETHSQLADDGSYIAIEARIELHEWVPGADFDPLAPPQAANPPAGIVQASPAGTTAGTLATAVPGLPTTYDPANQSISPTNQLTPAAVTQLGLVGAIGGVSYSPVAYSQPGVSGIAGAGPAPITPGNPADVPTSTIVRAG